MQMLIVALLGSQSHQRPQSKKKVAKQEGLYVPNGIFETVESEYGAKQAIVEENWLQKLDKAYPNMPSPDRAEICRICSSHFLGRVTTPQMTPTAIAIRTYVLDRYTEFKSLSRDKLDMEAASKAHQEASRILSIWRGKD
ncbi:hypothetical protein B0H67DRAFT_590835 [Lasiosphaeris hirsuta]|uniref:DUF2293 domain-containing protein n=1 Tax=Lasiosphaeris hirsuta TaxID=260670 RepID=A0AA40A3Q4_9PEZI|nr:hypothetical protein B0H67DRAFT_590835 [Lasiosphaeris hirsuta]